MNWQEQPYALPFLENQEVVIKTLSGSGLGYYCDPALPKEERGIHAIINGTPVVIERTWSDEDKARYMPIHVKSGMSFNIFFYEEVNAQTFLQRVLEQSGLDWNQSVDDLVKQPAWATMGKLTRQIAESILQPA